MQAFLKNSFVRSSDSAQQGEIQRLWDVFTIQPGRWKLINTESSSCTAFVYQTEAVIPNESPFALMLHVSFVTVRMIVRSFLSANWSSLPFSWFQVGKPRKKCNRFKCLVYVALKPGYFVCPNWERNFVTMKLKCFNLGNLFCVCLWPSTKIHFSGTCLSSTVRQKESLLENRKGTTQQLIISQLDLLSNGSN